MSKRYQTRVRNPPKAAFGHFASPFDSMSKRFGPPRLNGSTQEKSSSEICRFGYGKASNDKKVPDRVDSGFKGIALALLIVILPSFRRSSLLLMERLGGFCITPSVR